MVSTIACPSPPSLESLDPSNGSVVGSVPFTSPDDVATIVEEARRAALEWGAFNVHERGKIIVRAGNQIAKSAEQLGRLLSREMGKPLARGIGEVRSVGTGMEMKVERVAAALEPLVEQGSEVETRIIQDPLGVCGVIAPWNYPMSMVNWMVLPALMAQALRGNSVDCSGLC